jgi:glycerate kinase
MSTTGDAVPAVTEIRAARAVIVGTGLLDRAAVISSPLSEIATTARQSGVPCHAVVGSNQLDPFDTRILDLQFVIEATTRVQIEAAGAEIGTAMQADLALGH